MLPLAEAAQQLGLAVQTLRVQIKLGALAAEKRGRDWYVTPEAIEAYKRDHLRKAAS